MSDVFISYCSADRDRAAQLAQALEKENLSVWWDRSLVAGSTYDTEIDRALGEAKAVIVIWSQAAVVSEWVRSEAEEARSANKLVPVKIEECRVPLSMRRLQTADLSTWKGEQNHEFLRVVEAAKARVEGRITRPTRFVRALRISAIVGPVIAGLGIVANVIGLVDFATRSLNGGAAFAASESGRLGGETVSPETQEGFRAALAELARSSDLRTQRALTMLQRSETREEALAALNSLATDQGGAIEDQMRSTARLWRQIGLLRFNENPPEARAALERARRFDPDDPATLTALGALYQREGRVAEADEVYRIVLSKGAIDASAEGRVRQVLGQAYLDRGEADAAEREFQRALVLAQQSVDEALEANLYIDMGLVELDRLNVPAARQRFAEASEFAGSFDYAEAVTYAKYNDAEALIQLGQYDAAAAQLRDVRTQAEAQDDQYLQLYIDHSMATIATRQGDYERALGLLNDVRTRAHERDVRLLEWNVLVGIAENQIRLGRAADAATNASEAREGFRQIRAARAVDAANLVEAVAQSQNPTTQAQACARVRSADLAVGSAYLRSEMARLSSLARCPA